jgi:hypothetical protein
VSEALLVVTPFEVVKTRLQQQKGVDKALLKYRVRGACQGLGFHELLMNIFEGGSGAGKKAWLWNAYLCRVRCLLCSV